MKKITANGLTFITDSSGQGPKFLFITGTGGDLRNENSPLTSPLNKHFEVLTYDQQKIQDHLESNLSSRVKLKPGKKGSGEIVIYFHSDDDLERITELLS